MAYQTTLPLDQVYNFLRQPISPSIPMSVYGEEREKAASKTITSDFFRDIAAQLNNYGQVREQQVNAYAKRDEARQQAVLEGSQVVEQDAQLRQAQADEDFAGRQGLAKAQQLFASRGQGAGLLPAPAQAVDESLPIDTPVDEALVEEASEDGGRGFFGAALNSVKTIASGVKDLGEGAFDLGQGTIDSFAEPIIDALEVPFTAGSKLAQGDVKGAGRAASRGVAGFREPVEAAIEITREALRGDLDGLKRELKEAGREIPSGEHLMRAWDGLNQVFLGEQKIITTLTRPIIRETLISFGVPDGASKTIAKYAAEFLVPSSAFVIGKVGKTKGAAKLIKAALAEGSINMLQNRQGRKNRGEEDPSEIEDAMMFTFGFGGRIGMEHAARALSGWMARRSGKAVAEGVDEVTVYHGAGGKLDDDSLKSGSFVTTDKAAAEKYAAVDARIREVQGKPTEPTVYETTVPRDALAEVPEDATTLGSPFILKNDTPMRPSLEVKADAPASEPDDILELEHYTSQKLDEIDPSFAGTGKAGEEANIGGPRVSHFYTKGSKPERMVENLPNKLRVDVDEKTVLDLASEEGEALWARAVDQKTGEVAVNMGDFRQLAMDEGYAGIRNTDDPLNRVQMFGKTKVIKDAEPVSLSRAVADTKKNNGGTFDPKTGKSVDAEGYIVGGGAPRKIVPLDEFGDDTLDAFVRENAEVFKDGTMKLGTEVVSDAANKKVVNIDAITISPLKGREEALDLARTRGQQRVWDTSANGGKGANVEVPGVEQTQTVLPTKTGRVANEEIRTQATEYAQQAKLPEPSKLPYAKVDEPRAKRIADAYENATHDPTNPAVVKAYDAFKKETHAQWEYLKAKGVKFTPWVKEGQPYADSAAMRADIDDNKHLSFFRGGDLPADHPLAAKVPGSDLTYNDEFRAVHDYFGHAKEGFEFGPRGEENAWRTHSQMYGDEARRALTTETRGQNSWVNYGPEGKANRADPSKTKYPDQKATLLDEEFTKVTDVEGVSPKAKLSPDSKQPDTTKAPAKEVPGDDVTNKLADFTPEEKASVRTIVTATTKQLGSAAHSWVKESGRILVKVYEAIKKMGRAFHADELGAMRLGKKPNVNGIKYSDVMNIAAARRWLQPAETWEAWAAFMAKRVGGKKGWWLSTAQKDVDEYTKYMMGLLGEGPQGGGVKLGDKITARYGTPTHPRTYEELFKLAEDGFHLKSSTGEIVDMREWYEEFFGWMKTNFGDDAEIMTMFAATTQSNKSPAAGIIDALNAYTAWKLGQPITGMGSASVRKSIEAIIRGGVPTGPKINPFWEALAFATGRGRNSVAVDRWVFAALGAQEGRWKNLAGNARFIRLSQQIVRQAAAEAGLTPRSFQAAMWGGEKADWNKMRVAAGLKKGGSDFTNFENLFRKKMEENGLRAPANFRKLAQQGELFDVEQLERTAADALDIHVAGETRAQTSKRVNQLVLTEFNEKNAAGALLETGEIPEQIATKESRDRVTHRASMYRREFGDKLIDSDTEVLEHLLDPPKVKGKPKQSSRMTSWQKKIIEETLETRKASAAAPEARMKSLPEAERTRLKELGYAHEFMPANELRRVALEMKLLDEANNVPKITAWLKRNKLLVGDSQAWVGKSTPTGRTYFDKVGREVKQQGMSPYWEPKPFFETGYRLNISRIKANVRALYPDQRIIDGTNQTIGDALKANKKPPVGACA